MKESRIKTLLLFARYTDWFSYFDDWEEAFVSSPAFDIETANICNLEEMRAVKRNIGDFELIIALHSTNANALDIMERYAGMLNKRKGRFLTFVANEYNNPPTMIGMKEKIAFFQKVRPEIIATQLPLEAGEFLYKTLPGTKVLAAAHALNPERFHPMVPQQERKIDLGVRSFRYSPLMGDNDRVRMIDFFASAVFDPPMANDISTDVTQRFSANEWPVFLNECKGTISTEAGTYYLERDDHIVTLAAQYFSSGGGVMKKMASGLHGKKNVRKVKNLLLNSPLKRLVKKSIKGLGLKSVTKSDLHALYEGLDFNEVHRLFFKDYPHPVSGKCISSRHFDAIGTKTVQIMFPGKFNGILAADRHYIALEKDFSNIDDVVKRFRDDSYRMKMADETWQYVMDSHTYSTRIKELVKSITNDE